jgi:hypothetical protein
MMPADCSVLRTPTIRPNIRISRDYYPAFMLISGRKVFHPFMSKLMWFQTFCPWHLPIKELYYIL